MLFLFRITTIFTFVFFLYSSSYAGEEKKLAQALKTNPELKQRFLQLQEKIPAKELKRALLRRPIFQPLADLIRKSSLVEVGRILREVPRLEGARVARVGGRLLQSPPYSRPKVISLNQSPKGPQKIIQLNDPLTAKTSPKIQQLAPTSSLELSQKQQIETEAFKLEEQAKAVEGRFVKVKIVASQFIGRFTLYMGAQFLSTYLESLWKVTNSPYVEQKTLAKLYGSLGNLLIAQAAFAAGTTAYTNILASQAYGRFFERLSLGGYTSRLFSRLGLGAQSYAPQVGHQLAFITLSIATYLLTPSQYRGISLSEHVILSFALTSPFLASRTFGSALAVKHLGALGLSRLLRVGVGLPLMALEFYVFEKYMALANSRAFLNRLGKHYLSALTISENFQKHDDLEQLNKNLEGIEAATDALLFHSTRVKSEKLNPVLPLLSYVQQLQIRQVYTNSGGANLEEAIGNLVTPSYVCPNPSIAGGVPSVLTIEEHRQFKCGEEIIKEPSYVVSSALKNSQLVFLKRFTPLFIGNILSCLQQDLVGCFNYDIRDSSNTLSKMNPFASARTTLLFISEKGENLRGNKIAFYQSSLGNVIPDLNNFSWNSYTGNFKIVSNRRLLENEEIVLGDKFYKSVAALESIWKNHDDSYSVGFCQQPAQSLRKSAHKGLMKVENAAMLPQDTLYYRPLGTVWKEAYTLGALNRLHVPDYFQLLVYNKGLFGTLENNFVATASTEFRQTTRGAKLHQLLLRKQEEFNRLVSLWKELVEGKIPTQVHVFCAQ